MKIQLEYLKGSKEMGLKYGLDTRLWNVKSPQLANYPQNGGNNGVPTLGIEGLKQVGLL